MSVETIEELEEALGDILPVGFQIDTDKHGQIVVFTHLSQDDDGELVELESDEEEDLDVDPDFEPLEEEDDDD
jgi:hypothetical protein